MHINSYQNQFVDFKIENDPKSFYSLDLRNGSSITYNRKAKEFVYIYPAPPIKNLVLSGGGAKGVMLPGVLKAFQEHLIGGIRFRDQLEKIVGSSIGAVTASLFASGISAEDAIDITKKVNFKSLLGTGIGPIFKDGLPLIKFVRKQMLKDIHQHLLAMGLKDNIREFAKVHLSKNGKTYPPAEMDHLIQQIERIDIAIKGQNEPLTFGMLKALEEINPIAFKDLTITATCCEDGKTYYFNSETTPDLDIPLACRASASLPILLSTVPISLHPEKKLHFVDGGYFDNIPVSVFEKGEEPNLQTLAVVFEDSPRSENQQSPFLDAVTKPHALYDSSQLMDRFLRDILSKYVCRIKTRERNTLVKEQKLEKIRKLYTQRCIPLASKLSATDFDRAKKYEDFYLQKGYNAGKTYLENHDSEAIYHTFTSFEELLEHLPGEMIKANWDALIELKQSSII